MNIHTDFKGPGNHLYRAVRAGLINRGTNLNQWCIQHRIQRQNARDCLLGNWNGPKAKRLRRRLLAAAGVSLRDAIDIVDATPAKQEAA